MGLVITSIEQTVYAVCSKMALCATMEQNFSTRAENVSSLTAHVRQIEANATSVSSNLDRQTLGI